jgi:ABC-type branched-subunit amino acid transport system substrate-binding protein
VRLRLKFGLIALILVAGCAGRQETTPPRTPQPAAVPAPAPTVPATPLASIDPSRSGFAKIGLLLPLSGPGAALGADLLDAAQLALFDVGRTDLELLPRDTGDQPQKAEQAARSALDAGAELLLGPLYGRSASAVAPIAGASGVNVISFSNDAGVARPGLYLLGFRPEEQVERVVQHAAAQGRTRFAALAPADSYGARVLAAWRAAVARVPGATAEIAVTFPADSDIPKAEVQQLAAFGRPGGLPPELPTVEGAVEAVPAPPPVLPPPGFDALLIADGGDRVKSIAALLAYYDIGPSNVALFGTMRWLDEAALLGDPTLQGALLASWPPEDLARFDQRFADVYGRSPAPLAVLAYDATALAVLLAQDQPRFTPAQIQDSQGFVGSAGIFRLRPDGLADHGLAVVEIAAGGTRVIDPAPRSFAAGFAGH